MQTMIKVTYLFSKNFILKVKNREESRKEPVPERIIWFRKKR